MNQTFLYALIACSLFSFSAGPLGSLVVWRRLAFLGETLSHSALLGIALAASFDYPLFLGVFGIDLLIVIFLVWGRTQNFEFIESKLAVFSQASLAAGLIVFSFIPQATHQFNQFLFGDILALDLKDLIALAGLSLIVWIGVIYFYRSWILSWISEELAITHNINPHVTYAFVLIVLTLIISISIKILGALLITALMIIPAMSVRLFSSTPKQMMINASLSGILSTTAGLTCSYFFDIPASAAVTVCAFIIYCTIVITFRK